MLSLVVSILAISFIIAFHEFGHFIAARFFGVGVIEYSIGMGPQILSKVAGNTRYSVRAVPFGGYCMMLSEDMAEPEQTSSGELIYEGRVFTPDERFDSKPAWQRFLVIIAGPVFNFILAFVLALIITATTGYDRPVIRSVDPGMAVEQAGIEAGDTITALAVGDRSVRRVRIETARDIMLFMSVHEDVMTDGGMITMDYLDKSDGNKPRTAELTPVWDQKENRRRLGFSYSGRYEKAETLQEILYYSWYNIKFNIRTSLESIRMLVTGRASTGDLMGPVRMVATVDQSVEAAAGSGLWPAVQTLFNLMILISSSLGFMNLLPLPALDGGRLIFILIEMIIRRKVPKEIEGRVHGLGAVLLLLLMVFILYNDVSALFF